MILAVIILLSAACGTIEGAGNCTYVDVEERENCETAGCNESFCQNGGVCSYPNVNCTCAAEWTGDRCDTALCNETFCLNEGSCLYPNVNCTCPDGWEGDRCESAVCQCLNGGTCNSSSSMTCNCSDQWDGDQCEIALCSELFCLNGGTCSYPDVNCTCPEQWGGNQCQTALCDQDFCLNGGTCLYPNVNCSCAEGWAGPQCQEALCDEWFCLNGGRCQFPNSNCSCIDGWTGNRCSLRTNFNHARILYICIALSFVINFAVTSLLIGVIINSHMRRKRNYFTDREKEELWMDSHSQRYKLAEVIRSHTKHRCIDNEQIIQEGEDSTGKSLTNDEATPTSLRGSKAPQTPTSNKHDFPPTIETSSQRTDTKQAPPKKPSPGALVPLEPLQEIRTKPEEKYTSEESSKPMDKRQSKKKDSIEPVLNALSSEILLVTKKRGKDSESSLVAISREKESKEKPTTTESRKKPLLPPQAEKRMDVIKATGALLKLPAKTQTKKGLKGASNIYKVSSEEYYSAPDHTQSSKSWKDSHSIKNVANIAYGSLDQQNEAASTRIEGVVNVAYGALGQHKNPHTSEV